MEQAGILTHLYFDDGCRRYDLVDDFGAHHHHLLCTSCSSVTRVDGCLLDAGATRALIQRGYAVHDHELLLRGLCPRCRSEAAP